MRYLSLILMVCCAMTLPATASNNGRKLARTSNGDLHCTYDRFDGSYNQIYYAKSTNGGETWTETQIVHENYPQYDPSIAVDSNDYIHIVWYGTHTGSPDNYQIRYIKYTGSWQRIENLTNESFSQSSPAIAIDSQNHIHITWYGRYSGTSTKQIRYIKHTNSWQEIENLTNENATQYASSIAIDSKDHIHIAWYGRFKDSEIYTQIRYIKYTDSWQEIKNLTIPDDEDQTLPCIAVDSKDNVHIVWSGTFHFPNDYWMNQIRYIKYTPDPVGGSWSNIAWLSDVQYPQANPSIAIDANDYLHIVWSGRSIHSNYYSQIRHRSYTTKWETIEDLTSSSTNQTAANLIWAMRPTVSGTQTNRTKAGYAFIWKNDTTAQFYRSPDLLWPITGVDTSPEVKNFLYVITDFNASPVPLSVYGISTDGSLIFQSQYYIPKHGTGVSGLAIDADSEYLFVTYEQSPLIQLVNTKTTTNTTTVTVAGATNLAATAYERDKSILYCVDKNQSKLYAYKWNSGLTKLTSVSGSPFSLTGTGACGIALDETNDLLYLSNCSTVIKIYNTSNWSPAGTINLSQSAANVAVDAKNSYLYCGGGRQSHPYLIQYNLAAGTEAMVKLNDMASVASVDVDQATGYVYITTSNNDNSGSNNILVFDTSLNLISSVESIGTPADLAIPAGGTSYSYNALNIEKSIVGAAAGEPTYFHSGDTVNYAVCFDNINGKNPVTNVSIVDILPNNMTFVTADGNGDFGHYDSAAHRYVWNYPSLPAGAERLCLQLAARVNDTTPIGTTVTNSVTIDSDQTPPNSASVSFVTSEIFIESVLYISPAVIRRTCPSDSEILAIMELPQNIGPNDVLDEPFTLYPGAIRAAHQQIEQTNGKVRVSSFFNAHKLIDAITGYGYVKLQVTGRLKTGQTLTGEKIVRIL